MSSLYSGIIPIIKQAAVDAVNSSQPVNFLFGTVIGTNPLKIQVTPKLILESGNVIIPESLTKTSVSSTINGSVSSSGKTFYFNNPVTITLDRSIKKGDSLILARIQGGSKYLIVDRAVNA